jgi:hypothetical protein
MYRRERSATRTTATRATATRATTTRTTATRATTTRATATRATATRATTTRATATRATANAQLSFSWGGARENAGRPARGPVASERHTTRPHLASWFPVHVIARVDASLRVMSQRDAYTTIRRAVKLSLARTNFRIVRLAIHAQRLELLVEADDKHALARGMQGFQVSAARAVNRAIRRKGTVFPDRYRMKILRTTSAARAAVRTAIRAAVAIECPARPESALARAMLFDRTQVRDRASAITRGAARAPAVASRGAIDRPRSRRARA